MTSIVIIGDTHIASARPRNADVLRAFDQIIREGSALDRLGAWVHVGDVFDARSTPDDRLAVADRFQAMANRAPLLILQGNHEAARDLLVFTRLRSTYPVRVLERPGVVRLHLATGEWASVFGLPFPQKHGLVSAGVSPSQVQSAATDLLDPIFIHAADALARASESDDLTFMVGHATVMGSVSSAGQPMGTHGEIVVTAAHLDRLGRIPKIFGHIHKPQELHGAIYAGSVCRLDFGEIEDKRWLEIGLGDARWPGFNGDGPWDGDGHQAYDIMSHSIDVAKMFHVDGVLNRHGFTVDSRDESNDEEIHRRLAAHDWVGCDVRVRYSYLASEKAALDESVIREVFTGALRLKIEGVSIQDRALRAPAVAAAKTLPEKLAAYQQVEALSPSITEKLAALERQDPQALLAHVSARLADIEGLIPATPAPHWASKDS